MTQRTLTTNQPRFSIRTYSLGAASVLLAYACLTAGPVATANTTTDTAKTPSSTQTRTTSSTGQDIKTQVSQSTSNQSSTNQTSTTTSIQSTPSSYQEKSPAGTTTSSTQVTSPSSSPASSQQTTPASQESQSQTKQTKTNQNQTNTSSASSSAISQKNTSQSQTRNSQSPTTNQARATSTTTNSLTTGSIARGNDYPYTAIDAVDPWRLYTRQCTSFVAFRLSKVNGFEIPPAYGNADVWGSRARQEGYRVDMTPAVGAVAWWTSPMHVAWVSGIQGDMVEIEEYNYGTRYSYNRRLIHKNSVSGYIHFKDISGTTATQLSTSSSSLPTSGTYTFSQQAPIKNEAKQSSSTLDYYYAGESVRYDQVLTADGYQWISYLSYSGQRRYVPIKQIQTSAASQQTPATTVDKPQGTINITNINQATGSFDVFITNVKSPKTITSVSIPIWSDKDGQDDLVWYPAQRQSDGSYKVSVQASKHKNDRGLYHIHAYYTDAANQLDFVGKTTTQLPTVSQQPTSTNSLPASGTYTFKSRASVRNQPSLSSAEVAYYNAGSLVRYDKVVTAEGRQWISYVSFSGARRYIAIP
ncbi:TPA: SH3 domain-containing protein [Streptococcus suis]